MSPIPEIFDKTLVVKRRRKAHRLLQKNGAKVGADFLLRHVVDDMDQRLSMVLRTFPICVELGGHTGLMADRLADRPATEQILRIEQDKAFLRPQDQGVVAELDYLPLATASCHLIVSPLFLHWVNDLPGSLIQIRHSLKPDGLFLASLLGRDSLSELKDVFLTADSELSGGAPPRVAPLARHQGYGQFVAKGRLCFTRCGSGPNNGPI